MKFYLNTRTGTVLKVNPKSGADLSENSLFIKLTKKQADFYFACIAEGFKPSKDEILAAKRSEIFRPQLEQYKTGRVSELDMLSLQTFDDLIPAIWRENARNSLLVDSNAETIYTRERAIEIIEKSNKVGAKLRKEFHRIKKLIKKATSIEEVDIAFNSNQYSTFE